MIKIYNKIIPPSGYKALCLWPFLFVRALLTVLDLRHENIHGVQQREMLIAGTFLTIILMAFGCGWWSLSALPLYFWWYGIELLVRFAIYRNFTTAYKNVAFEREAYSNQEDVCYIDFRVPFAWVSYIKA